MSSYYKLRPFISGFFDKVDLLEKSSRGEIVDFGLLDPQDKWVNEVHVYLVLLCQPDVALSAQCLKEYCNKKHSDQVVNEVNFALNYNWSEIRRIVGEKYGNAAQFFRQTENSNIWVDGQVPTSGNTWPDFRRNLRSIPGRNDMFEVLISDNEDLARLYIAERINLLQYLHARFRSNNGNYDRAIRTAAYASQYLQQLQKSVTGGKAKEVGDVLDAFKGNKATIRYLYNMWTLKPPSEQRDAAVVSKVAAGYAGSLLMRNGGASVSELAVLVEDIFLQVFETLHEICSTDNPNDESCYLLTIKCLDQKWCPNGARRKAFLTDMLARCKPDIVRRSELMKLEFDAVALDVAATDSFQDSYLYREVVDAKLKLSQGQGLVSGQFQPKLQSVSRALSFYSKRTNSGKELTHFSKQRISMILEWCIFLLGKEIINFIRETEDVRKPEDFYIPYFPQTPACLGTTSINNDFSPLSSSGLATASSNSTKRTNSFDKDRLERLFTEAVDVIDALEEFKADKDFKAEYKCLQHLCSAGTLFDIVGCERLEVSDPVDVVTDIMKSLEKNEIPVRFWSILSSLVCLLNDKIRSTQDLQLPEGCLGTDHAFLLLHCIEKLGSLANSDSLPKVSSHVRDLALSFAGRGIVKENKKQHRIRIDYCDKSMFLVADKTSNSLANLKFMIADEVVKYGLPLAPPGRQELWAQDESSSPPSFSSRNSLSSDGFVLEDHTSLKLTVSPHVRDGKEISDSYFLSAF